jgi:hypothetical protein
MNHPGCEWVEPRMETFNCRNHNDCVEKDGCWMTDGIFCLKIEAMSICWSLASNGQIQSCAPCKCWKFWSKEVIVQSNSKNKVNNTNHRIILYQTA